MVSILSSQVHEDLLDQRVGFFCISRLLAIALQGERLHHVVLVGYHELVIILGTFSQEVHQLFVNLNEVTYGWNVDDQPASVDAASDIHQRVLDYLFVIIIPVLARFHDALHIELLLVGRICLLLLPSIGKAFTSIYTLPCELSAWIGLIVLHVPRILLWTDAILTQRLIVIDLVCAYDLIVIQRR